MSCPDGASPRFGPLRAFALPRVTSGLLCVVVFGAGVSSGDVDASGDDASEAAHSSVTLEGTAAERLFTESCINCHSGDEPEAGVSFDAERFDLSDPEQYRILVRAVDRTLAGEMPPPEGLEIDDVLRRDGAAALGETLRRYDRQLVSREGRSRLRRLSRVEYQFTVQDLLKVDTPVGGMLPYDTNAHGFDRTADALSLSDVLMEKYLAAAEAALADAVVSTPRPETTTQTFDYLSEQYLKHRIFRREGDAVAFFTEKYCPSELREFRAETPGRYRVRITARAIQTDKPLVFSATYGDVIGGRRATQTGGYFEARPGEDGVFEFTAKLETLDSIKITPHLPSHPVAIWQEGAEDYKGVGLAVSTVEITGPLVDVWPPASHAALFKDLPIRLVNEREVATKKWARPDYTVVSEDPAADSRRLLSDFAGRAFRRPIEEGELDAYFALIERKLADGERFQDAFLVGVKAVLCSPDFLCVGGEGEADASGRLSPWQLASRLSYFLWSSLPDDQLRARAADGSLTERDVLLAEADRMLADPRSDRLVDDLLRQWLDLEWIDSSTPDPGLYPEFDARLKQAMVQETTMYVSHLMEEDLAVRNLIDSDFTFLNERLAQHYGIEGVEGIEMRKVDLPPGCCRGGVLTQAAIMKVTANGTNTSPVLRGLWMLENILGEHVPPPPKNVPAVEPDVRGATSVREQFAAHRTEPVCASCHVKIDPLGFALEAFDPIGGLRENYRAMGTDDRAEAVVRGIRVSYGTGPQVEAADTLPDGRRFEDINTFKQLLCMDCEKVAHCYAGKLLVYATGAGLSFADRDAVDGIVQETRQSDHGMRSILKAVIASEAFRTK